MIRILRCIFHLSFLKAFYKVINYVKVDLSVLIFPFVLCSTEMHLLLPWYKIKHGLLEKLYQTRLYLCCSSFPRKTYTGIKSGRKWDVQFSGKELFWRLNAGH